MYIYKESTLFYKLENIFHKCKHQIGRFPIPIISRQGLAPSNSTESAVCNGHTHTHIELETPLLARSRSRCTKASVGDH